jgi:hypothetical protein
MGRLGRPIRFGLGLSPFLEVKELPLSKERGCINLVKQYQTNQSSFSSSFSIFSSSFSAISSLAVRHPADNLYRPHGHNNLVAIQVFDHHNPWTG